ncbi:MAG: hypothetical protein V1882_05560 [Candidatus Omnitrophota bacterium]
MKIQKAATHEKGFVLLVVYMIVIFVSIFSAVLFARNQVEMQATERYQNRVLAFNAGEASIDFALRELSTDAARRSGTATTPYTSSEVSLGQHAFRYTISPVTGHSMIRRIDATGCAPSCDNSSRAYQTSLITVFAEIETPIPAGALFEYGIYATNSINLSGSTFDSYNSSLGAYGGSNISEDGAVAGDTTAAGGIALSSTTVRGDAAVDENGNPNTVITQTNSIITGTTGNLPAGWTLGAPTPMAELPTPPTEVDLSNVTSSRTLNAGTYHCSSIGISGSKGKIVTNGAVQIYVDGAVSVTGIGTTVTDNKPGNLHIYVTGSSNVMLRGNGSFYGGIYAPNSDVTFQTSNSGKGGTFFGAVVSKTFSTWGGGAPAFHFDLAMKEDYVPDPNQVARVGITTWQELNSLAWGTGQTVT